MDNKSYLPIFLDETRENIQIISESLLGLEQNPDNREALNEFFRAIHTIKGMSATMGFEEISMLGHEMENFLDLARNGDVAITSEIVNAFFEIVDEIEEHVHHLQEFGRCKPVNHARLTAITCLLRDKIQGEQASGIATETVFFVKLRLSDDCMLKAARLLTIVNQINELGNIISSDPSLDDIVCSRVGNELECTLKSKFDSAHISAVLDSCVEIDHYEVHKDSPEPKSALIPDQAGERHAKSNQTIRIDTERMDQLLNLVSELVINKTSLQQHASQVPVIGDSIEHLNRLTGELQTIVMKMRMIPVETVFNRFPRMVRDTARGLGKSVRLEIHGGDTELDRTIIEDIADPLLHLIRNSIDHGIEAEDARTRAGKSTVGTITLRAYQTGNQVIIEVSDDGRGLDLYRIRQKAVATGLASSTQEMSDREITNHIFDTGLSTSEKVTDLSGRGVGLDVAKKSIETLGGTIQVSSEPQVGTTFTIRLPLTLAIIQGLLIQCAEEVFVLPLSYVRETDIIMKSSIQKVGKQSIIMLRGKVLPVITLADLVDVPDHELIEELNLVIIRHGDREIGLICDDLLGQQEIVIKNIRWGEVFFKPFLGATILGDGGVVLILDVNTLLVPFKDKEDGKVG